MPLSFCTTVQLKEAGQGVLLAKLCVMVMMTAKLILLCSSLPFLHWPTFCMQNVHRIRYIFYVTLQGWTDVFGVDMNTFYRKYISPGELKRVESLEPFDEYEEFLLKCSHYFMLIATKGSCVDISKSLNDSVNTPGSSNLFHGTQPENQSNKPVSMKELSIDSTNASTVSVFGHSVCDLSDGTVAIIGGFGEVDRRHCRFQSITLYDTHSGSLTHIMPDISAWEISSHTDTKKISLPTERLYHTSTAIRDNRVLLIGGRTSPTRPCQQIALLHFEKRPEDNDGKPARDNTAYCDMEQLSVIDQKQR